MTACSSSASHSISLKDVEADGSEPRVEREFKYSLIGKTLENFDTSNLT